MAWQIKIYSDVRKRIARLPEKERIRLVEAISFLGDNPFHGDVKPLQGRSLWRLRVGGWRVLFRIEKQERIIYVVGMGPRGDVYK